MGSYIKICMELHEITRRSSRKGNPETRLRILHYFGDQTESRQARETEKRPMKKGES